VAGITESLRISRSFASGPAQYVSRLPPLPPQTNQHKSKMPGIIAIENKDPDSGCKRCNEEDGVLIVRSERLGRYVQNRASK
jgi:hypothetical protein